MMVCDGRIMKRDAVARMTLFGEELNGTGTCS